MAQISGLTWGLNGSLEHLGRREPQAPHTLNAA